MAISRKWFQPAKASLPLETWEDGDLVAGMRQGYEKAFEIILLRYNGVVLGVASRFLRNPTAARDVAQEVFLALWTGKEGFDGRGSFRGYLCSMTVHRCLNLVRRERLQRQKMPELQQVEAQRQTGPTQPLQRVLSAEKAELLWEKLLELPDQMRETLMLRYLHEMSLEEVASFLALPLGTVKSHLSRGLKRMYSLLAQEMA